MTEALRILLKRLLDYAGLFSPAGLSMKASIDNFKAYRAAENAWMLNRFVLPATRLSEFIGLLERVGDVSEWELSATIGPDVETEVASVVEFNRRTFRDDARAVIRSVEIKTGDPQTIRQYRQLIPGSIEPYFEFSGAKEPDNCIAAIAETNSYANLRTGGDTAATFPDCAEVAHFLAACTFANVPFKCTAGLRHPLRGVHPYTAQPNGPSGKMHGFLNVFLAAALAQTGATTSEIEVLLAEESIEALHWGRSGIRWRGHFISNEELGSSRNSSGISFSSPSFTEPLDDLRELRLI